MRRSPEKYQVLQATLVDTWASTAAGAFALSENNLYTTDAFYDYLTPPDRRRHSRLHPLGLRSAARIAAPGLARHRRARRARREARRGRHVIVARENVQLIDGWGARDTVLISRKPFTADDVDRARGGSWRDAAMQAVYLPGDTAANPFTRAAARARSATRSLAQYPYDISPVNDNRPFFFYTVQPRDLLGLHRLRRNATAPTTRSIAPCRCCSA